MAGVGLPQSLHRLGECVHAHDRRHQHVNIIPQRMLVLLEAVRSLGQSSDKSQRRFSGTLLLRYWRCALAISSASLWRFLSAALWSRRCSMLARSSSVCTLDLDESVGVEFGKGLGEGVEV